MLMDRPATVAIGALGACAVMAAGAVLLQERILGFTHWPHADVPEAVPPIVVPRSRGGASGAAVPHRPSRHGRTAVVSLAAVFPVSPGSGPGEPLTVRVRRAVAVPGQVMTVTGPVAGAHPELPARPPLVGSAEPSVVPAPVTGTSGEPSASADVTPVETPIVVPRPDLSPRASAAPAELAPPVDPAPVSSADDNAPPPADPGSSATSPEPAPEPAPEPVPPAPEPAPADPAPPAEPVPAEPAPAGEPVPTSEPAPTPTAEPTAADPAPSADSEPTTASAPAPAPATTDTTAAASTEPVDSGAPNAQSTEPAVP